MTVSGAPAILLALCRGEAVVRVSVAEGDLRLNSGASGSAHRRAGRAGRRAVGLLDGRHVRRWRFARNAVAADPGAAERGRDAGADRCQGQPAALPAIATECPPIKVRPGAEALFFYGSGQVGNPQDLQYQAEIDKQTRNCVVSNGLITVKMGVVGRVLLGPSGKESVDTVPLRFAVERDGTTALYSELYQIPVTDHAAGAVGRIRQGRRQRRRSLSRQGDDIIIWVGFDSRQLAQKSVLTPIAAQPVDCRARLISCRMPSRLRERPLPSDRRRRRRSNRPGNSQAQGPQSPGSLRAHSGKQANGQFASPKEQLAP